MNSKRYIVFCSERSDGSQCNSDYVLLIESSVEPTKELIERKRWITTGNCTNVSGAGCENCPGSYIASFRVEPYSVERAKEFALVVVHEKSSEPEPRILDEISKPAGWFDRNNQYENKKNQVDSTQNQTRKRVPPILLHLVCIFGHDWVGCKCRTCSKIRDIQHDWNGCKCRICGKIRDSEHDWTRCKCCTCGKRKQANDPAHKWNSASICQICGLEIPQCEQCSGTGIIKVVDEYWIDSGSTYGGLCHFPEYDTFTEETCPNCAGRGRTTNEKL